MYQTRFMTYLANNVDSLLPQITQHLKSLHKLLINPSTLKAFIVSEQDTHNEHESLFAKLQNQLVSSSAQESYQPISLESVEINPTDLNTFAYPFNSYYSSRALSTVPFQDPTSPHYQILSTLLTHLYLHREIREKGGAYGGGATHDSTRGTLSFYSYRDPNPYQNCEQVYKQSLEWALNHKFEERELNEAKLSVFQSIDHPLSASQEGLSEWTSGITLDMAKARRHTFLTAKEADLKVIAEKLLHSSYPKGASVIIGQADQESISKGWKLIQPINV
jgi:Zn-dependent M16 (insulinase) family peptidase